MTNHGCNSIAILCFQCVVCPPFSKTSFTPSLLHPICLSRLYILSLCFNCTNLIYFIMSFLITIHSWCFIPYIIFTTNQLNPCMYCTLHVSHISHPFLPLSIFSICRFLMYMTITAKGVKDYMFFHLGEEIHLTSCNGDFTLSEREEIHINCRPVCSDVGDSSPCHSGCGEGEGELMSSLCPHCDDQVGPYI